ncbi:hypothetical protein AAE478_006148 [Parahypoxylon ruwenzoriense]
MLLITATGQGQHLGEYTIGKKYNGTKEWKESGLLKGVPKKLNGLLKDGKLFVKAKPQYGKWNATKILDAHYGISNDGTGHQIEKDQ